MQEAGVVLAVDAGVLLSLDAGVEEAGEEVAAAMGAGFAAIGVSGWTAKIPSRAETERPVQKLLNLVISRPWTKTLESRPTSLLGG